MNVSDDMAMGIQYLDDLSGWRWNRTSADRYGYIRRRSPLNLLSQLTSRLEMHVDIQVFVAGAASPPNSIERVQDIAPSGDRVINNNMCMDSAIW